MTLEASLREGYAWAVGHATVLLAVLAAWPIVGLRLARIGKAGRTDEDGRAIASIVVGVAVALALFTVIALVVSSTLLGASVLSVDVRLLLAPLLCVADSLLGIRLVFPLAELGAVRTLVDFGAFLAAGAAIVWLFSRFRGWGFFFVGSIGEALEIPPGTPAITTTFTASPAVSA